MVASSPRLSAAYQEERSAAELLRHARERDRAPAGLRSRIEADRPTPRIAARRRLTYSGALAGAFALAVIAIALFLPGGTPGAPTLSDAAALATRGPTRPAPLPDPHRPAFQLAQAVDETYFPNWTSRLNWRATGQRVDRVGNRKAVTVYYSGHGRAVAYTIVGAPALAQPTGRHFDMDGLQLRALSAGGRMIITWRRGNNTCVLSGVDVTAHQLGQLAAWRSTGQY